MAPWRAVSNTIHDNTIVHLGSRGQNGVVTDTDDSSFWDEADNRFDLNSYVVADRGGEYWTSNDWTRPGTTFKSWGSRGTAS